MVEARSVNVKKTTATTTSNKLDVQNEWEENTHTHRVEKSIELVVYSVEKSIELVVYRLEKSIE